MHSDKIVRIRGILVAALVIIASMTLIVGLVIVIITVIRYKLQAKKKKIVRQRMHQTIHAYFPNCEKVVEMYKDGSFTVYADKKEYEVILSDDGTKIIYQEPEYIYEYNTGANEDIDEWSTPF